MSAMGQTRSKNFRFKLTSKFMSSKLALWRKLGSQSDGWKAGKASLCLR
jgi:hypothetical protein